jgi:hypothetical protein
MRRALALIVALVVGAACSVDPEAASSGGERCDGGVCSAHANEVGLNPAGPGCANARKDEGESDVDCGGSCTAKCEAGRACRGAEDCASLNCVSGACAPASCTDGIKNQDESDVDCGGGCPTRCAASATCTKHTDCASNGCDYRQRCAIAPSCTSHHGGDTCGPGPDGDPNGVFESCCVALPVKRSDGVTVQLDKYVITAGRMRAFVERYDGNLQQFIDEAKPKAASWWNPEWRDNLPKNKAEALEKLGPLAASGFTRQGCEVANGGARTYWQPPIDATEKQAYDQNVLDEKALNCVEIFTLAAFCLWDGGHLAYSDDLVSAWGPGPYPWGATPEPTQSNVDPTSPIYDYVVHEFGNQFEGPYSYTWPTDELDQSAHIAAPGRKPLGAGPFGHMDLAGLVFQMSSGFGTAPNGSVVPIWLYSGTWEAHEIPKAPSFYYVANDSYKRGYWAAGGRCAR